MSFPAPKPGLVIRYSFLWSNEAKGGADEGLKDRPCAVVVAAPIGQSGDITVIVAPVTHSPPDDNDSIEIPAAIARGIGLDELNRFMWLGYDLRQIPGQPGRYDYGLLPKDLYEALRIAILERQKRTRLKVQGRD